MVKIIDLTQNQINSIIELVTETDYEPFWVEKEQIELEWYSSILNVIFNENYTVQFDFSVDGDSTTTLAIKSGGLNLDDVRYMECVMSCKDEIADIINK